MDKQLQAIRDAMDKTTGDGRDELLARALADKHVAANPGLFGRFKDMSIHDCVRAVEVFRDAGMPDEEQLVETWILHHFNPQDIGGAASATVRITNNG